MAGTTLAATDTGVTYDFIGDQTLADAILEKIGYDSHRIEHREESLRRRQTLNSETQ